MFSFFNSYGISHVDFTSFEKIDPSVAHLYGGVANSNNMTFAFVPAIFSKISNSNPAILQNMPFQFVIKMACKDPLEKLLNSLDEKFLLQFALDLITKTTSSTYGTIFGGFVKQSEKVGEFVPNSKEEFEFPVIFLDLILDFLKKRFKGLYLWKQREKTHYYALENVPYLISDFAFVHMKLFDYIKAQYPKFPKPKSLDLPFSLQTLLGIFEIPHDYVHVETLFNFSQLISKRDDVVYLQKQVWQHIVAKGNGKTPQFIPLARNQYGFESILIIGDMIFVFQMKYKKDSIEKLSSDIPKKWLQKMRRIIPILTSKMGFKKENIRFVFLTNASDYSMEDTSVDGVLINKISKDGLAHITNLNTANQKFDLGELINNHFFGN